MCVYRGTPSQSMKRSQRDGIQITVSPVNSQARETSHFCHTLYPIIDHTLPGYSSSEACFVLGDFTDRVTNLARTYLTPLSSSCRIVTAMRINAPPRTVERTVAAGDIAPTGRARSG